MTLSGDEAEKGEKVESEHAAGGDSSTEFFAFAALVEKDDQATAEFYGKEAEEKPAEVFNFFLRAEGDEDECSENKTHPAAAKKLFNSGGVFCHVNSLLSCKECC